MIINTNIIILFPGPSEKNPIKIVELFNGIWGCIILAATIEDYNLTVTHLHACANNPSIPNVYVHVQVYH